MDNLPENSRVDFDAYLEEDEVVLDDDDFMDFIGDDVEIPENDLIED